ncbi:Uncharacterised protein [Mycobacteroides abscessus subsp. abscessus]|nr:Uncharacterised protein [Mycobacteroides abscessus subsp. abscessus]
MVAGLPGGAADDGALILKEMRRTVAGVGSDPVRTHGGDGSAQGGRRVRDAGARGYRARRSRQAPSTCRGVGGVARETPTNTTREAARPT